VSEGNPLTEVEEGIPLARPVIGEREEQLVLDVLRSGRLSLGPLLERFERDFASAAAARALCPAGPRACIWRSGPSEWGRATR
jgi:hypothetical protein